VPHEFNYRFHPDNQKHALAALYAEVGFARSLLAYELPDGRLKLIDGHLRRDMDPIFPITGKARGACAQGRTRPDRHHVLE
jgi:hypothetical protein